MKKSRFSFYSKVGPYLNGWQIKVSPLKNIPILLLSKSNGLNASSGQSDTLILRFVSAFLIKVTKVANPNDSSVFTDFSLNVML